MSLPIYVGRWIYFLQESSYLSLRLFSREFHAHQKALAELVHSTTTADLIKLIPGSN